VHLYRLGVGRGLELRGHRGRGEGLDGVWGWEAWRRAQDRADNIVVHDGVVRKGMGRTRRLHNP
jgi:hypothetical protein